jgi:hypothetical protein
MNKQLISAIALACSFAFTGAWAAGQAETNIPASAPKVSKEERKAAATERKAEAKAAVKKGETPKAGEASTAPAPAASKVSAAERKAAAKKRRAEAKEATKKGEMPPAGEATPKK